MSTGTQQMNSLLESLWLNSDSGVSLEGMDLKLELEFIGNRRRQTGIRNWQAVNVGDLKGADKVKIRCKFTQCKSIRVGLKEKTICQRVSGVKLNIYWPDWQW